MHLRNEIIKSRRTKYKTQKGIGKEIYWID